MGDHDSKCHENRVQSQPIPRLPKCEYKGGVCSQVGLTTGTGDDVTGAGDDISEIVCHVLGGESSTTARVLVTGSSIENSRVLCEGVYVCVCVCGCVCGCVCVCVCVCVRAAMRQKMTVRGGWKVREKC